MFRLNALRAFFADSRNSPQFLNKKARSVFALCLLLQICLPLLAVAVYQHILVLTNQTAEQAGTSLPAKIIIFTAVLTLLAAVPLYLLFFRGEKERKVIDLEDLMEGADADADDPINPKNTVLVVVDRIHVILKQYRDESLQYVREYDDLKFQRLTWKQLSGFKRAIVVVLGFLGASFLVYGVYVGFGFMSPRDMPVTIDVTRPNGLLMKNLRSGSMDWMLGLMSAAGALICFTFARLQFEKMYSKSDESLKKFMGEMGIN